MTEVKEMDIVMIKRFLQKILRLRAAHPAVPEAVISPAHLQTVAGTAHTRHRHDGRPTPRRIQQTNSAFQR
jgi:hypothetical protein